MGFLGFIVRRVTKFEKSKLSFLIDCCFIALDTVNGKKFLPKVCGYRIWSDDEYS